MKLALSILFFSFSALATEYGLGLNPAKFATGSIAILKLAPCPAGQFVGSADGLLTSCLSGGGIGGSTGSTDNAALRADGGAGSTAQSSLFLIDDSGYVTIPTAPNLVALTGNTASLKLSQTTPNTGASYSDIASVPSLALMINGRQYLRAQTNSTFNGAFGIAVMADFYPDAAFPSNLGVPTRNWLDAYTSRYVFGGNSTGDGFGAAGLTRQLYLTHGGWGYQLGIGFDARGSNGNEFYLKLYEPTTAAYVEDFNVKADSRITTVSAPANAANDATPGQTLVFSGGAKSAGSGDGGGTVLDTPASFGGTVQPISFKVGGDLKGTWKTTGAFHFVPQAEPASGAEGDCYVDSTSHKLTCHDGSTWHAAW